MEIIDLSYLHRAYDIEFIAHTHQLIDYYKFIEQYQLNYKFCINLKSARPRRSVWNSCSTLLIIGPCSQAHYAAGCILQ